MVDQNRRPSVIEFRISNFEFRICRPQSASSPRSLQSAWRCCGGPRREGRETWSAGARLRAPDGRVSRAAAEARSDSAAATLTSGVTGLNRAPRNRSAAKVSRSRRRWAYDGVSPTGARRNRSRDRPDREEGGKRRHRSGAGAISIKVGGGVVRQKVARRRAAGARGRSPAGPRNARVPRACR